MLTLVKRMLKAAKEYTLFDFACIKVALLSFGLLIGAYFSKFFLNHTFFLWVAFILTYLWVLYRTFFKTRR
ncbi:MAG: hypothetical protein WCR27_01585 [Eubacteriales bacterium]